MFDSWALEAENPTCGSPALPVMYEVATEMLDVVDPSTKKGCCFMSRCAALTPMKGLPSQFSKATVSADDSFSVKLDITNHGSMAGKVVVQVYFTQDLSSRVRYEHMLLGFGKVEVAGGATVKGAQVELKARDLEMWDKRADKYVVEASTYSLAVGQFVSDPAMHTTTLTVTA